MSQSLGSALIRAYFPELDKDQYQRFEKLEIVYTRWNAMINVVSRKDMGELYIRHVLHSLAIAKFIRFSAGTKVFDFGTGGGFPGIPLAILFPETEFVLCDSIAKKLRVVSAVAEELQLKNISTYIGRAEQHRGLYDFVVSRAVAEFPIIRTQTKHLLRKTGAWICLKGGEIEGEFSGFRYIEYRNISDWFEESFFETKKLIQIPFQ